MAMTLEEHLRLRALEEQCGDLHKRFDALHELVRATLEEMDRQTREALGRATPAGEGEADARPTPDEPALAHSVELAQLRVDVAKELARMTRERQKAYVTALYTRREMRTHFAGIAALLVVVAVQEKVKVTLEGALAIVAGILAAFGLFWFIVGRAHAEEKRVKAAVGRLPEEAPAEKKP